jgi:hypothetical protein
MPFWKFPPAKDGWKGQKMLKLKPSRGILSMTKADGREKQDP